MHDFANQIVYSAIFVVLPLTYRQDTATDIDAKYVKDRGFAQECAFLVSQNQNVT